MLFHSNTDNTKKIVILYIFHRICRKSRRKMDKKVWKSLLILVACIVLVISAVFAFVLHSEVFMGFLYGAGGVALFMILAKLLSLIQREGKEDD